MQTRVEKKPSTTKRMLIMIGAVLGLIAIIAGIKALSIMRMIASFKPPPPAVVTTAKATYQEWQPELRGVGTLRALRGADLALDVAGLVTAVNVRSGQEVKAGQLLLQLRDTEDVAQLRQLEATAALAQVTYARAQAQAAVQVISKADYDTAAADLKAKQAAVEQQKVLVSKKQLRAPFAGRAGIVTINPGTYLNAGTVIVTLQELDPIYVDFHLPQRNLAEVHVGQRLTLTLDAFPDKTFEGAVSAVSPKIDTDTRNVQIEGKAANHDRVLTPGMFVNVSVDAGAQKSYLTLPQTAVVFNPYGETVFIVQTKHEADQAQAQAAAQEADRADPAPQKTSEKKKSGPAQRQIGENDLVVRQVFVTTGPTRGDQVAVLKGLKDGDVVVSSGQIKLKNGAPVTIDNRVLPSDNPNPNPQEK
jgi:membrane fusion protein (multidrug efflux system)